MAEDCPTGECRKIPGDYPTYVELHNALKAMTAERDKLKAAIVDHRSQKADDRCIFDDDKLYEAVGDGIKCDRRVGDQAAMLQNCALFIKNRTQGGTWRTYAELEARVKELEMEYESKHEDET